MRLFRQPPEPPATAGPVREPIGLIAGWGTFPLSVADALRRQGKSVCGLGIRDHADPSIEGYCDHFAWIGACSIGKSIRMFRRWNVQRATMAGKVHKVLLMQPRWWLRHRPDWKCIRVFYPQLLAGTRDAADDTLLGTVVRAFGEEGIVMEPATDFAPELLVPAGHLAGKPLSDRQVRDVEFGWRLARGMGGLDVGQTVCVRNQAVLAVEAIEGTDECIRRAGELARGGSFTVVKTAKPQQDMRFDVPTVGVSTLESVHRAGGTVLAIEAEKTIVLERERFCQLAARLRIGVVALKDPAAVQQAA